ncbi:MAG: tRNA lysidine(34) synthetase TilS [Cryomorphaceae bacterium]|nr:tRNA lysidine(34) synthetase TilS [Cryomorphaceae bacterium]
MLIRRLVVEAFQRCAVSPSDRLLIACSGGIDSVVLVALAVEMRYEFALAHVNHHTRGNHSDGDEAFVKALAEKHNVPFHRVDFRFDKKGNFQQSARSFRYNWLAKLAKENDYQWICTAHHRDDQRETFWQNAMRGAGVVGLQGIREKSGQVLRPMLKSSKKVIRQFAIDQHLTWREDASNAAITYARNYIRHIVLPHAASMHPRGLKGLDVTIDHLTEHAARHEELLQQWRKRCLRPLSSVFEVDPEGLPLGQYRADWLKEILLPWGNFDTHMILEKADSGESGQSAIGDYVLETSLARIFLYKQESWTEESVYHWQEEGIRLNSMQRLYSVGENQEVDSMYLTEDMKAELVVRSPKAGDRLLMPGGNHKKLSDYLLEKRIPAPLRRRLVWLVCYKGEIIWIPTLYSNPNYTNKSQSNCKICFLSPLF